MVSPRWREAIEEAERKGQRFREHFLPLEAVRNILGWGAEWGKAGRAGAELQGDRNRDLYLVSQKVSMYPVLPLGFLFCVLIN